MKKKHLVKIVHHVEVLVLDYVLVCAHQDVVDVHRHVAVHVKEAVVHHVVLDVVDVQDVQDVVLTVLEDVMVDVVHHVVIHVLHPVLKDVV